MNEKLYDLINENNVHSAWGKGVKEQALELVEKAQVTLTLDNVEEVLLDGTMDWEEYSYSGNALIHDEDIAERYCTPSELKRCDYGNKYPTCNENWLDLQARALHQAYQMVYGALRKI